MLDLLVFTQHTKAYAPKRLREEATKLGCRVQVIGYSEAAKLQKFPEAKAVILREPDYKKGLYELRDSILNHYLIHKSKILNHKSYTKWSVLDKITQHQEFAKANIPYIPLLNLSDAKFPFIAKNKLGSHGDSVYKITCKEDLDKVSQKHDLKDLLIQEFQNSGFDLRVIVLGGRILGIMKRTPREGEFLSNYSQGGRVEQLIINNEELIIIKQIATEAAKHFMLDYVGVDLMMGNSPAGEAGDGDWKVLEVNRACQFKGFEQATGVNVASKMIEFLNI